MNMNTYTRTDIIRDVSEKLDIPEVKIKKILDSILTSMVEILTKPSGKIRIELRNFGVFEIKPTQAKPRARNPRTNKEVYVPAHRKIHFRPGKTIRDVIQQEWIED